MLVQLGEGRGYLEVIRVDPGERVVLRLPGWLSYIVEPREKCRLSQADSGKDQFWTVVPECGHGTGVMVHSYSFTSFPCTPAQHRHRIPPRERELAGIDFGGGPWHSPPPRTSPHLAICGYTRLEFSQIP